MAYKQLKLWFDKVLAVELADKILDVHPDFPKESFVQHVKKGVPDLELKDRVEYMADALKTHLDGSFKKQLKVLMKILGPENQEETGMFANFYWVMPIAKFVEKYGLDDFKSSMNAIAEITKRNTGEYTIRPFLDTYPKETLAIMKAWSKDPNVHLRRLASEGGRPRLPWATKLDRFIKDPKPLLPILNQLKNDQSKYVQKSVANCLNDILKDNPDVGKVLLEKWKPKATKECQWIIKHALRNLIKAKDSWALRMVN